MHKTPTNIKTVGLIISIFLLVVIPATVTLVKQRQEQRGRAQGPECKLIFQHNECIECNTSKGLYKDECTGKTIYETAENNVACATLCCENILVRKECVACNVAQFVYKDSCTDELVKGAKAQDPTCVSLCN